MVESKAGAVTRPPELLLVECQRIETHQSIFWHEQRVETFRRLGLDEAEVRIRLSISAGRYTLLPRTGNMKLGWIRNRPPLVVRNILTTPKEYLSTNLNTTSCHSELLKTISTSSVP